MLIFIDQWKKRNEEKKLFLGFYAELRKNLESYYVMDQLGRFRFFRMEIWKKLKEGSSAPGSESLQVYVRRLEEYNALLEDFTKYEQWYAADIERKTQANGKILHDKREEPRQKFQGLEPVIKAAIRDFEQHLSELKILKN